MAFDLTCLHTLNANLRSASSWSVGRRLLTTSSLRSSTTPLSRDCTRKPPERERNTSPGARGSGRVPVVKSRRFFLAWKDRKSDVEGTGDGTPVMLQREEGESRVE